MQTYSTCNVFPRFDSNDRAGFIFKQHFPAHGSCTMQMLLLSEQ